MLKLGEMLKVLCFVAIGAVSVANATEIKQNAPELYTVKKGDTLWQIAGMYLEQPWLWPKLWQKNAYIQNPHLIYPGDVIRLLVKPNGEVELELVRSEKKQIKLSPKTYKTIKVAEPIPALPWELLNSYVRKDMVIATGDYDALPYLLGDQEGAVRFATGDTVLGKHNSTGATQFKVIRSRKEIFNHDGESLGLWVQHISSAEQTSTNLDAGVLVEITDAKQEVKPGDRLLPMTAMEGQSNLALNAATTQLGKIITSLHDHALLGKYDIAIIDLGELEVEPGTVMGIYSQGPDIIDGDPIEYEEVEGLTNVSFIFNDQIQQPALKVGELVVFKVFDAASFGLITSSTKVIRSGSWVAKP